MPLDSTRDSYNVSPIMGKSGEKDEIIVEQKISQFLQSMSFDEDE
jgi:hypothetical protein